MILNIHRFNNIVFHGVVLQCFSVNPIPYVYLYPSQWENQDSSIIFCSPEMIHYNDSSVYYNYPGYHFSQNIDSTVYHNSEEEEKEKNILCSSTSLPQCPQVPHMSLDLWSYQYSTTRYLIIKPWAPQDLERSYQIGYWSIPLNKVDYLNAIFETTKDIYLIFSLTRSGGYFGYAQMLSPVVDVLSCHQSGRGYSLTNTPFERKNNNKQKSKLGKNKAKEGNLKTINCLGILSLP